MSKDDRDEAIARCIHYVSEVREAARRHRGTAEGVLYGRIADDLTRALGEMINERSRAAG